MSEHLVFIGDSLTEWFDWQKRFPDYRVTNLGKSGETVEGLLGRRESMRSRIQSPDYVFLMTGINNIAMERYDITVPYREIVKNLTTWYNKSNVVVQSVLPVEFSWISNETIRGINRDLKKIADEYHADYLDVYSSFIDAKGNPKKGLLQDDGVHIAGKGYEVWAAEVERFLHKERNRSYQPVQRDDSVP